MATLEELQRAAIEQAKLRRSQKEQAAAAESRNASNYSAALPPKEEAVTDSAKVSSHVDFKTGQPTTRADTDIVKQAQQIDDLMRVTAGPVGNALEAAMTEKTMNDSAKESALAKARLGEAGPIAAGAGQVAQALAIPGSALATPLRAAATSGVMAGLDSIWHRMSNNQPLTDQEGLGDIAGDALTGAGLGFTGFHLGKGLNNLTGYVLSKLGSNSIPAQQLTRTAERTAKVNEKIQREAGEAMKNSGVEISRAALARMHFRLRQKFEQELLVSPRAARHGFSALSMLGSEGGRPGNISLPQFNQLRKIVRDSVRKPNGQLSDTVNANDMSAVRMITREMNQFIENLPKAKNAVRGGDAAAGVAAWKRMNAFYQRESRTNVLVDAVSAAERAARKGGISVDEALRAQFFGLIDSKAGRALLESERFSPAQIKAIEDVAYGDISSQTLNTLDKMTGGSGILTFAVNVLRKGTSAAAEADAARYQTRKALEEASQLPIAMQGMLPPTFGARAGALAGMNPEALPQSTPVDRPPMRPLPESITSGQSKRPMREFKSIGGQKATPEFPTIPGLEDTKKPGGQPL